MPEYPTDSSTRSITAIDVLRRIIAASGVLMATDLVTGEVYSEVVPCDVETFLAAHMLWPKPSLAPPSMHVVAGGRARSRVESFVLPRVRPVSPYGSCTHVSLSCKTRDSRYPSNAVLTCSLALQRAGLQNYLERSVRAGIWTIWIPFASPAPYTEADATARCAREVIGSLGIIAPPFFIPLLDNLCATLVLPGANYRSGYYGTLHLVDEMGSLRPLNGGGPSDSDGDSVGSSMIERQLADGEFDVVQRELNELISSWCAIHGARGARAGELLDFAIEAGTIPSICSSLPRQAASITLGRALILAAEGGKLRSSVRVMRSGNSHVFRFDNKEWRAQKENEPAAGSKGVAGWSARTTSMQRESLVTEGGFLMEKQP